MPRKRQASIVDDAFLDDDFAEQVRTRWQRYNAEALATIRAIQQQGLASILAQLFGGGTGAVQGDLDFVAGEPAYELVRDFLQEQRIFLKFGQAEFLKRYNEQSDLRIVVATIQDVTGDVEDALRPQHDFQKVIQRLYSGGKTLNLNSQQIPRGALQVLVDGKAIPLQSLSSGEKQLLRLMLEALAAEDGTVMIDEPELSMHVDGQQELVADMRLINPDCQLLLATHSPEIMADVPDHLVFQL